MKSALDHIAGAGKKAQDSSRVDESTTADGQAGAAGAGAPPPGAEAAWEYWGNGTYYETAPGGGYSGAHWDSEG